MNLILMLMSTLIAGEEITYAAGYIPNVQFAPFYVARHRGYYAEEGIELRMDYTMGTDILKLAALGKVQIASADPDAFLHAAVRKLPLTHVATLYQTYPIALIAKEPILTGEGLRGKRIGISGTYGSSYLGLEAMLSEMELKLADVRVVAIGFTQVAALRQGSVDAVVGYLNNEPVRLQSLGLKTHTRTPGTGSRIPGVGLMTSNKWAAQNPELLAGFLRATFRGMHDVVTDPHTCFDLVVKHFLPELELAERYQAERAILMATLPYWSSAHTQANGYGQCPEPRWQLLAEKLAEESGDQAYLLWSTHVDRSFSWQP